MKKYLIVTTIVLLLVQVSVSHAQVYSWTDRDGNSHITNDISKVPSEYQPQARKRQLPDQQETEDVQSGDRPDIRTEPKKQMEKKAVKRSRTDTDPTDNNGRGEAYWHDRVESLRERLEDLRLAYDSICSEELECERKRNLPLGKRQECSGYVARKERVEKEIGRTRQRLDVDLPEEARKAGAYPGWLR